MNQPTAAQIANKIAIAVYNSGQKVFIANSELKEISERSKLREGLVKPIVNNLQSRGFDVDRTNSGIIASYPLDTPNPISFNSAIRASERAQREQCRTDASGVPLFGVLYDDGTSSE